MSVKIYDVLLVGTGPPMLFEGLALAQTGACVVFVDRGTVLGGSWRTPDVLGFAGVEVGVHLIENRPHLNRLFHVLMGQDELTIGTPDFAVVRGRRLPMRSARIFLYALVASKNLLKLKIERVWHSLKNAGAALRYISRPLIYPRGGIASFLKRLEERLLAAGAEFRMGQELHAMDITPEGITATLEGAEIRAKRLIMSSRAHVPIKGHTALWQGVNAVRVCSVVLHLKSPTLSFAGYGEIIGDSVLKRVRDVAPFVAPKPAQGEALITVQLRNDPGDLADGPLAEMILSKLIALNLLEPNAECLALHRDFVPLGTLPGTALSEIERRFPDQVTVLRTVDLGDQVYQLRKA